MFELILAGVSFFCAVSAFVDYIGALGKLRALQSQISALRARERDLLGTINDLRDEAAMLRRSAVAVETLNGGRHDG